MFVIHDADHSADNVTLELQTTAPLLRRGDYVVVEDTNVKIVVHDHGPGPVSYTHLTLPTTPSV